MRVAVSTIRDGVYLVGGVPVQRGDISDLSAIGELKNLVELTLCYENITDVSALQNLTKLTYLDLSGNAVSDLEPLSAMDGIAVLKLSHTSITDFSACAGDGGFAEALRQSGHGALYFGYPFRGL